MQDDLAHDVDCGDKTCTTPAPAKPFPTKEWNIAIRNLLIKYSGLYPSQVLLAGQVNGPTTPHEFVSYERTSMVMAPYTYHDAYSEIAHYDITYQVVIYSEKAEQLAMSIMQGMQRQSAKDVMQPLGMGYRRGQMLGILTEYINNKGYNRADLSLVLTAGVKIKRLQYIDKANIEYRI